VRIFIDCEWNDYKGELISMALVSEFGQEWYGIRRYQQLAVTPWVAANVIPKLNGIGQPDELLRLSLRQYLNHFQGVEIVADWPEDIAHFCDFLITGPGKRIGPEVMNFTVIGGVPGAEEISLMPHNALEDARALKKFLANYW
tara:strand:- start:559 stop:987 length:429 start_codon:yes stop_codon:yes gene_type:complete